MVRKCVAEMDPYTFLYQKGEGGKKKINGLKLFIPLCVCAHVIFPSSTMQYIKL